MYKIVPKDLNLNLIYVGHTTNFKCRKSHHKGICNNLNSKKYNYKVYQMIRENGGWDEWEMIEIEKYSCLDKNEACKRERELMEEHNASLNSYLPLSSQKEWYDINKEYCKNKNQQYYINNKDTIVIKQQEYYEKNKDAIIITSKEWVEKNKDKNKDNKQKWYQKNKVAILAKQKEKRLEKKLQALKLENK
jgi:hypothetical protein